jgi:hypothetical protein
MRRLRSQHHSHFLSRHNTRTKKELSYFHERLRPATLWLKLHVPTAHKTERLVDKTIIHLLRDVLLFYVSLQFFSP